MLDRWCYSHTVSRIFGISWSVSSGVDENAYKIIYTIYMDDETVQNFLYKAYIVRCKNDAYLGTYRSEGDAIPFFSKFLW